MAPQTTDKRTTMARRAGAWTVFGNDTGYAGQKLVLAYQETATGH
jgi:hypothetical protein